MNRSCKTLSKAKRRKKKMNWNRWTESNINCVNSVDYDKRFCVVYLCGDNLVTTTHMTHTWHVGPQRMCYNWRSIKIHLFVYRMARINNVKWKHQILHRDCLLRFEKQHAKCVSILFARWFFLFLFSLFLLNPFRNQAHLITANICFVRISNAFYFIFSDRLWTSRYHFMHQIKKNFLLSSTLDGVSNIGLCD